MTWLWVVHSERSEESPRCVCSLFVGYIFVTRKVGGVGVWDANFTGYKNVTRKVVGLCRERGGVE